MRQERRGCGDPAHRLQCLPRSVQPNAIIRAMLANSTSVEQGASSRVSDGGALDPLVRAQCSLSVQLRRATGSIIGRDAELAAISQEIKEAANRLAAVTLEGEPGIGKTRLLLAACRPRDRGGLHGRSRSRPTRRSAGRSSSRAASSRRRAIRDTAAGTPAEAAVRRVVEAMSGRDEPGFESLSPDAKVLRAFDLAGVAIAALADVRPLALLIDDVQWADDDTLRMLRYVGPERRRPADLPVPDRSGRTSSRPSPRP